MSSMFRDATRRPETASPVETVRAALDDRQAAPLDQCGHALARDLQRNDAIGVAVNDQRRHSDPRQVGAKVRAPGPH
jgi:hypothetical protein